MFTKRELELFQLEAEVCKAFSDPKRLVILGELRLGQKSVSELVRILEIPQAAVSRHLAVLRERGLVNSRREGASVIYSLSDPRICEACDILREILFSRIEQRNRLVQRPTPQA